MSRCLEFYEKWEKTPNWCEKCTSAVKQINSYIELVTELEERGIDREITIVRLTEGAARPILTEKNPDIKEKAIESIKKTLESKKEPNSGRFISKISGETVENIIRTERAAVKKEIAAAIPDDAVRPLLYCGDFREEIKKIPDNSVDLIITDPLWQDLGLWDDLARESARVLKGGGYAIIFSGTQEFNKKVFALSKYLNFYWMGFKYGRQHFQIWPLKIFDSGSPILFYSKNIGREHEWLNNVYNLDKWHPLENLSVCNDVHKWGKPLILIEEFINKFTSHGDIVLDPMMGGGSTIEGAINTKRKGIGIEIDKPTFEGVYKRLVG